jgi:hypothetical protein
MLSYLPFMLLVFIVLIAVQRLVMAAAFFAHATLFVLAGATERVATAATSPNRAVSRRSAAKAAVIAYIARLRAGVLRTDETAAIPTELQLHEAVNFTAVVTFEIRHLAATRALHILVHCCRQAVCTQLSRTAIFAQLGPDAPPCYEMAHHAAGGTLLLRWCRLENGLFKNCMRLFGLRHK